MGLNPALLTHRQQQTLVGGQLSQGQHLSSKWHSSTLRACNVTEDLKWAPQKGCRTACSLSPRGKEAQTFRWRNWHRAASPRIAGSPPPPHPLHEKAPRQKEISTHQPWTEQTRQCAGAGGKHRAGTLLSPAQEQPHPCNLVRDFRKMSYHCISVFPTWVQGRGPALCRTGLLLVI